MYYWLTDVPCVALSLPPSGGVDLYASLFSCEPLLGLVCFVVVVTVLVSVTSVFYCELVILVFGSFVII